VTVDEDLLPSIAHQNADAKLFLFYLDRLAHLIAFHERQDLSPMPDCEGIALPLKRLALGLHLMNVDDGVDRVRTPYSLRSTGWRFTIHCITNTQRNCAGAMGCLPHRHWPSLSGMTELDSGGIMN